MTTPTEHRGTARVLDIMELLASEGANGLTLSQIASRLSAPKSSLLPILHTMRARHFLRYDTKDGRYFIGLAAFAVGCAFSDSQTLLEHLRRELCSVVSSCNETCQMGVLDGTSVLYVLKEECSNSIRLISSVGQRLPLYCTALGKAMLMCAPKDLWDQIYPDSSALLPRTPHTITQREVLFQQLTQMKAQGYAHEYGEGDPNICCFAVPIFLQNQAVASISLTIPIFRYHPGRIHQILPCLFSAQQNIESLLRQPEMAAQLQDFLPNSSFISF